MFISLYKVKAKGTYKENGRIRPFDYSDNVPYHVNNEATVDDLYNWLCFSQPGINWDKNSITFKFLETYNDRP